MTVAGFTAQWAGPDRGSPTNQYDVLALGSDGTVYHLFFVPGSGWVGPYPLVGAP